MNNPISADDRAALDFARDALRRIYSAANGIVIGDEPPRATAEDIQRMAINGLKGRCVFDWTHHPTRDDEL